MASTPTTVLASALVSIVAFAGAARIAAPSQAAAGSRPAAQPLLSHRRIPPIGVLDSGVDAAQPALAGKVVAARDFVDRTGETSDAGWHGTAVAGVILADTCPACTVVSARVLSAHDSGRDAEIARGLLWAVDAGARVVNLSMSGPDESPVLRKAIEAATRRGAVVVAAAGNDGTSAKSFPAADPNVIGVAATDDSGALFGWSNRGSWVTIAAPGETTTTLRGGGYTGFRGTSAAAPAVAAAAAECLAVAPHLSPAAVRRILVGAAAPVPGMPFGRLDLGRTVAACAAV